VVNNGKVWHHLMPFTDPRTLRDFDAIRHWLCYYNMPTPLTAVGTFSNRTRHFLGNATSGYDVRCVIERSSDLKFKRHRVFTFILCLAGFEYHAAAFSHVFFNSQCRRTLLYRCASSKCRNGIHRIFLSDEKALLCGSNAH